MIQRCPHPAWLPKCHGRRDATRFANERSPRSLPGRYMRSTQGAVRPKSAAPDRCVGAAGDVHRVPQNLSSPPKLIGRQDQTSAAPDRCLGAAGEVHKVPSDTRAGPTAIWTAEMHSNNTWNRSHLHYNHKMMLFRSVAEIFI